MFRTKKYIKSLFEVEWTRSHKDYINKNWNVEQVVRQIIEKDAKEIVVNAMSEVLENVNNSHDRYSRAKVSPKFQAAFIEHLVQAVNKVQLKK